MTGPRLTITVQYEPQPDYGRSLEWIAPELGDAGLTLVEDRIEDVTPSRTWTGIVDGPTFQRFAKAWRLQDARAELGSHTSDDGRSQPTRSYVLDGLNWETDGKSPITCVTLQILGVTDPAADSGRPSAEV